MAPGLTSPIHPSGHDLEDISGQIDAVNVLLSSPTATAATITTAEDPKPKSKFRQYVTASAQVQDFYKEQHEKQTLEFNLTARKAFHSSVRARMGVWEAIERLNTLIDESDPDTSLSQIQHLLQTAEAMRRDGKPKWMQVTGLIHDLGKLLFFFGAQGQWDVVGDTFPVGCAFDSRVILAESFAGNPDTKHPIYSTEMGIYTPHCGLDNLLLSWGHDEYLYHVFKDQSALPDEALAMIRYHSFYPWHREGAYRHFMNEKDWKMLEAVKEFNPYDLYSKSDAPPVVEELKPYYIELIDEFFPKKILDW
ncbi:inositol oxygenase [Tuber brumale]|nr:inositol oxygenase [Tuber brumale]